MKKTFLILASLMMLLFAAGCEKNPAEGSGNEKPEGPAETPVYTATKVLGLNPDFININGLEEGSTFEAGEKVTLTIAPGEILMSGFQPYHMEHIHIHIGDQVLFPEYPAGIEADAQELKMEFEVPEEDFEVVATYSIQQQFSEDGHTMTLEENKDGVKLYGVAPQAKYKYFNCALLVPDAYTINNVEFCISDGQWQNANDVIGCGFERSEVAENVYLVSIRPDYQNVAGDVKLRVTGEQHKRAHITWKSTIEGAISDPRNVLPTEMIDGEYVQGEIWFADDVYLADVSTDVPVGNLLITAGCYVTFTMPAQDVTVTLDVRNKIPVSYIPSDHFPEAVFYSDPDTYYGVPVEVAQPGKSVFLLAQVSADYKPVSAVTANGVKTPFHPYEPGKYFAEVAVPEDASELSVSIEDEKGYYVMAQAEVQLNGGDLYVPGENVHMAIYVPAGKKISSVKVSGEDGSPVQTSDDFPYCDFTMPAFNVTVSVEYENTDTSDQVSVIAYFDEDQYIVGSSTNYDWDFAEGFTMTKGGTFYMTVDDQYGENFYVGVKIGGLLTVYAADYDEDMGMYWFGKAFVADGDIEIKVGPSKNSVEF